MVIFDAINIILFLVLAVYFFFLMLLLIRMRNQAYKLNYYSYIIVILSLIFWTLGMINYRISNEWNLLTNARILYLFSTFIASTFAYFANVFPDNRKPKGIVMSILLLLNIAIVLLLFHPYYVIKDAIFFTDQENVIIWGRYYFLFVLYNIGVFFYGYYSLIKKYFRLKELEKKQILFVFWGYSITSALAMYTNLLMVWWGNFKYNWTGQVLSIIVVIVTVYTIIKYRFLDIRFVLRKSSVYLFSITVIIIFTILSNFFFELFFPQIGIWTDFFVLITAVLLFPQIKEKFSAFANKYFFTSLYNSREVIERINEKLRTTLRIKVINKEVADSLLNVFYCHSVGILFYNAHKYVFTLKYKDGLNFKEESKIAININLQKDYLEEGRPILVRLIRDRDYIKYKKFVDLFESLDIEVIVPLMAKGKLIGIIVLGKKISGDIYSEEDLGVLRVISDQTAVSIDNSLMYEQVKGFNVKLEKEIERATKELRKANEELKKLDAAKSEFISIASHQLRTPLTVIKGYISMILEKNFGEISYEVEGALQKVYESNERLVKLVEDLLNISRIESGRLVYKFQAYQIEKLIESVIEELAESAKSKNLKLIYHRPDVKLPKVEIDSQKMRQVVMNLVDNSIKYTSKAGKKDGKTEVFLELKNNKILFSVVDNGIGISSSDLPNLFQKFSRGKGVSVIHTEGTGLGLYVAKQIIMSHNGRIWAESEGEGKGAKMCFELSTIPEK